MKLTKCILSAFLSVALVATTVSAGFTVNADYQFPGPYGYEPKRVDGVHYDPANPVLPHLEINIAADELDENASGDWESEVTLTVKVTNISDDDGDTPIVADAIVTDEIGDEFTLVTDSFGPAGIRVETLNDGDELDDIDDITDFGTYDVIVASNGRSYKWNPSGSGELKKSDGTYKLTYMVQLKPSDELLDDSEVPEYVREYTSDRAVIEYTRDDSNGGEPFYFPAGFTSSTNTPAAFPRPKIVAYGDVTVRYLAYGTGTELIGDQHFFAKYGTVLNDGTVGSDDVRQTIPGYNLYNVDPGSLTVGDDPDDNVITVYYTPTNPPGDDDDDDNDNNDNDNDNDEDTTTSAPAQTTAVTESIPDDSVPLAETPVVTTPAPVVILSDEDVPEANPITDGSKAPALGILAVLAAAGGLAVSRKHRNRTNKSKLK